MRSLPLLFCVSIMSASMSSVAVAQRGTKPTQPTSSVYERISASVVTIVVSGRDGAKIRSGSGVIISSDGTIVTNYHVVKGGTFFDVFLSDDERAYRMATTPPGRPVDSNPLPARPMKCAENDDLAALHVFPVQPLQSAKVSSGLPDVGTKVLAVGSPYGLEGTLSEGIVSQIRSVGDSTFIQTTAQISAGSSGGGLFLENGELIGITTMSIRGGQGLNFAIPTQSISRLQPCASFAKPVAAQTEPAVLPSLWLGGVEVRLGASKSTLLRQFTGPLVGRQFHTPDDDKFDVWGIYDKSRSNDAAPYGNPLGTIQFRNDRVIATSRDWATGSSQESLAFAVLDAVTTMTKESGNDLTVSFASYGRTSNGDFDEVSFFFGEYAHLSIRIYTDKDKRTGVSVTETLHWTGH